MKFCRSYHADLILGTGRWKASSPNKKQTCLVLLELRAMKPPSLLPGIAAASQKQEL